MKTCKNTILFAISQICDNKHKRAIGLKGHKGQRQLKAKKATRAKRAKRHFALTGNWVCFIANKLLPSLRWRWRGVPEGSITCVSLALAHRASSCPSGQLNSLLDLFALLGVLGVCDI
jgi:hypothetical protein